MAGLTSGRAAASPSTGRADSHPDIYAVGDAVEKTDSVSGGSSLVALANVANRQGRRVADHIAGLERPPGPLPRNRHRQGVLPHRGHDRVERGRLREAGRPYRCIHAHPWNHATYYPGAEQMTLKLLFDPVDGTILGAQAVGGAGVDKRIDMLATAMSAGLRPPALADLELAYAPPFSSAKDPVNMLGYMSENILSGECDVVEPDEVDGLVAAGWTLLDVRTPAEYRAGTIPGAVTAPLDDLRRDLTDLGPARSWSSARWGSAVTPRPSSCTSWARGPQPRRRVHHLAGPGRRTRPAAARRVRRPGRLSGQFREHALHLVERVAGGGGLLGVLDAVGEAARPPVGIRPAPVR